MRESKIEKALKAGIEDLGGECYKWVSPGRVGPPDRICVFDFGFLFFAELKSTNGEVEEWQEREHARLKRRGFKVFVLHDLDSVWYVCRWAEVKLKELKENAMKPKKPKPKPKPC